MKSPSYRSTKGILVGEEGLRVAEEMVAEP